jgi:CRP-like cAMP-binding protein
METRTLHEPKATVSGASAAEPLAPLWSPAPGGLGSGGERSPAWHPAPVFETHGVPVHLRRGSPVYTPGQAPTHLYWVAAGEVSLVRHTLDGRELMLDVHREDSVFGEQELLLGTPRHCEAVCRADSRLLSLTERAVWTLRRESAEFAWWLSRVLAARQSRLEARLEALLFKSAPGKVAQLLVDLVRDYGRPSTDGTLIDYPITHQEIGSMIGTTRETVSYAFMDFRQKGWIATRRRRIIVRDLRKLAEAASA